MHDAQVNWKHGSIIVKRIYSQIQSVETQNGIELVLRNVSQSKF